MANAIIVGVDDSETAARAAAAAADLAVSTNRTLHVVTAYEHEEQEVIEVGSDRFVISTFDEADGVARSVASALRRPGLEVTSSAALGKPNEVLLAAAKDHAAEVIVVGNRRMQGPGRILGSVANSVAHHAPCDVYIVKTT